MEESLNKTELHIELYNNLTDINFKKDDINFLESIKYKMNNGNILLRNLIILDDNNIPFTIVKGFILDEEPYSKFERCIISVPQDYTLEDLEKVITEISISKIEDNLYELLKN